MRGTRGYAETDLYQPYLRVVVPRRGGRQLTPLFNHLINGVSLASRSVTNLKRKALRQNPYEGLRRFLHLTYDALSSGTPLPVGFDEMSGASRAGRRAARRGESALRSCEQTARSRAP